MAAAPTAVTVDLSAAGSCVVSIDGVRADPTVRGNLPARADPGVRADPDSAGLPTAPAHRCDLPYASLSGKTVLLRVIAPPGAGLSRDSFPRLDWYREGDRVIGTATLPAAPSFVSLHPGAAVEAGASFGWNFYGFFVFAAAFIASYFAWATWMSRRDRARPAVS